MAAFPESKLFFVESIGESELASVFLSSSDNLNQVLPVPVVNQTVGNYYVANTGKYPPATTKPLMPRTSTREVRL